MRILFVILFSFVFVGSISAETKAKKKRVRWRSQSAIVKGNETPVYQYANFDAKVIALLPAELKVTISQKIYQGIGGLGTFYKVRVRPRVYGYVSDVDVVPQFAVEKKKTGFISEREKVEKNPEFQVAKDDAEGVKELLESKHVGFVFSGLAYKEEIARIVETSNMSFVGLKMVGPGVLFEGPPINFEIVGSASVPSFYEKYASGPVSGFLVMSHVAVPIFLPYSKRNTLFAVWFGAMGLYSKFNVPGNTSSPIDSQEARIGFAGLVSLSHRISKKYIFQADYKYYFELNSYSGYSLSIGVEY